MKKYRKISKKEALKHIAREHGREEAKAIAEEESDEFILNMGTALKHYTGQHALEVQKRLPDYSVA